MAKHVSIFLIMSVCILFSACGGGGGGGNNKTPPPSIPDNVILVDSTAVDAGDGSSWANAYNDLQDALAVAVSGQEIWVVAGTYYTTDTLDRTFTFQLIDGVDVYGGFAGLEVTRTSRNVMSNVSILSGDIGVSADKSDNAHHVVTGADNAVLDGFTVRDGNAAGAADASGGGIYCNGTSPTIIACNIIANESVSGLAGGVYCSSASPVLINCAISDNQAGYGGGVYCTNASAPSLTNCLVVNNTSANTGGGIRCWANSSPTLTNCTISGNDASIGGGLNSDDSTPTLLNCIVWGNKIGSVVSDSLNDDYVLTGSSTDTVSHSLFISSYGSHAVVGDPMFTDAAGGDYTLLNHAPAIDFGDNSVTETIDLAGNPRKTNGPDIYSEFSEVVDIGAYESQSPPAIAPNVILVDLAAIGLDDGSNWDDAYNNLQDALAVAEDGNEIWVAADKYYASTSAMRTETFQLIDGVGIYGGFDGTENERIGRDVSANASILSGDIGTPADNADNTYHVVTGADNAILDGFTISDGNAVGAASPQGGGIYCYNTSPSLRNCIFSGNNAASGGAISCANLSAPNFTSCLVRDNSATANGGGLHCSGESLPVLTSCTISGNNAAAGGGVYSDDSSATLRNCIVWRNKVSGVLASNLSGDYVLTNGATDTVTYSLFVASHGTNAVVVPTATALFKDAINGDYALVDFAPAIDVGDNSVAELVDLAGNPRRINGPDIYSEFTAVVDIGAYESQSPPLIAANVILVDLAATGADDGSTWADAYNDLQDALLVAGSGAEIWVAAGTYYTTVGTDRTETFQLIDGVKIYGGFDATETERAGRDVAENVTTLSGDIGVRSDNTDNTHHVVTGVNNAVLDGFTISDGNTVGAVENNGGGLYCGSSASPTLNDCIISGNSAGGNGGGVYCGSSASPVLTDCTITENSAALGGGIYFYYSSPIQITCTITANTAGSGAGVYLYSSSPTLSNCLISTNESQFNGGGVYGNYTSAALENCTITDNTSDGGSGGGIFYNSSSAPTLTMCTISDNTADSDGGGIVSSDSSPTLSTCSIINNTSGANGGGLYAWDSSPTMVACLFSGNEAINWGGGAYCYNSSPTLRNCTVSRNDAVYCGGLYLSALTASYFYNVLNCVVWGNSVGGVFSNSLGDDYRTSGGNSTVSNSLFVSAVSGNTNGVVGDPLFTDAVNGDFTLQDSSPAIDMGDNTVSETVDLAGNPRKVNGPDLNDNIFSAIVDIGVYENQTIGASTLLAPIGNN